jgi:hypothetical protein
MSTNPQKTTKKKPVKKDQSVKTDDSVAHRIRIGFKNVIVSIKLRVAGLLARRPHRSFRRTMRRDYVRTLKLPGYWSFTNYVRKTLVKNKKTFLCLVGLYGVLSLVLVGLASQDNYTTLSETLRATGGEIFNGNWGQIGQAGLLLVAGMTGNFNGQLTESQQIYAVVLLLLTWLTTVWLLRSQLAGMNKPRLREGLYNAGAPILSTFAVLLVAVLQLLPVALAAAGFGAALASGLFDGGVAAMMFWTVAALLLALSLYWMTSTLIALVVVTLPGMYPLRAIKIAGDLVIGRRLRVLLRLLWLVFTIVLVWVIVMIPVLLFDSWLKGVWPAATNIPLVPAVMLVLSSFSVMWAASYVYLFYRKVVDDDTSPA